MDTSDEVDTNFRYIVYYSSHNSPNNIFNFSKLTVDLLSFLMYN